MNKKLATTFALSAAALFLSGCGKEKPASTTPDDATAAPTDGAASDDAAAAGDDVADADGAQKVKCFGINECKGQSECDVAGSHECGGQNECKGKGWISIPKSECDEKGGEILS